MLSLETANKLINKRAHDCYHIQMYTLLLGGIILTSLYNFDWCKLCCSKIKKRKKRLTFSNSAN